MQCGCSQVPEGKEKYIAFQGLNQKSQGQTETFLLASLTPKQHAFVMQDPTVHSLKPRGKIKGNKWKKQSSNSGQ